MISQPHVGMQMVLAHWHALLILTAPPNTSKKDVKNCCHIFKSFSHYFLLNFLDFRQANLTNCPKPIEVLNTTIHKAHRHWVEAAGSTFTGRNMSKNTMNNKMALNLHRVINERHNVISK